MIALADKKVKRGSDSSLSIFSNVFYFLGVLFKLSPALVVLECTAGVMRRLPTRIISVLGVKYVIDVIAAGGDKSKIITAVVVIGIVLLVTKTLDWLYCEFFFNTEREKLEGKLSQKLYKKARQLDLENYDNPDFYNNFILVINSSAGGIVGILSMIQGYVTELVSFFTICSIMLALDPVCLLIIVAVVVIFTPLSKKIGELQAKRQIENNRLHRRADYFARIFYLQDYCKEVRVNNVTDLLIKRYNEAADAVVENQKRFVKKIDFLYFFQESGVQIIGFMLLLPLYLGYCVLVKKTLSAGDFVATFNGAFSVSTSFSFLTVGVIRNFSELARLIDKYREFLARDVKILDGENVAECGEPKKIELKNEIGRAHV